MRIALWSIAALMIAGCTLKKGSGKGGDLAWKVDKVDHPLTLSRASFPGNGYDLVLERAVLREERTVWGPQNWRVFVEGVVVNLRGERIGFDELSGKFTVVGRSGKVYSAYASTRGSRGQTGWLLQEHTKEPTHLPPGARGLIEVFAGLDGKEQADAPVAFTFQGDRAELR
jgi:hypothetical protein